MSNTEFYLGVFKSIFLDNQNVSAHNTSAESFSTADFCRASNSQEVEDANSALAAQKKRVIFYQVCIALGYVVYIWPITQ